MDYANLFERITKLNILIIGDVMIDSYMWGKVERISPEAPVPIVSISKSEERLGGAANVALNIASMGAEPILASVIGKDSKGRELLHIMENRNMSIEGIYQSENRKTTVKTRVLGNKVQLLRVDEEIETPLIEEDELEFIRVIKDILSKKRIDAIIFQDYDKGVITPNIIDKIVRISKARNIPTAVDPKKRNFLEYRDVTLFKPNLKELKEGLKIEFDKPNLNNLDEASKLLRKELNLDIVFVTLSEYGVYICDFREKEMKSYIIPAFERSIADVSGAGDTVISVSTICLALGLDSKLIAQISNLSGGLVCERIGVVPIEKDLLYKEITSKLQN